MKDDRVTDLLRKIRTNFSAGSPPQNITSHLCEECEGLREDFEGKRWDEVSEAVVSKNYDKLPLFTPEAYFYFFPAFLIYSLNEGAKENGVLEFFLYSLSPSVADAKVFWESRNSRFNDLQRAIICEFLRYVRNDAELYSYQAEVERGMELFNCELSDVGLFNQ